MSRRRFTIGLRWWGPLLFLLATILPLWILAASSHNGPLSDAGRIQAMWGEQGLLSGQLYHPRAMAVDAEDRVYVVDKTARIQVFSPDGAYLHGWRTPERKNGKPTGLSFLRDGLLAVPDTHYFRVLFYTPEGQLLEQRTMGGASGQGPGQFGWVTDVAQDSKGNLYVSEYGELDRIQKFAPDGTFLMQWGHHGDQPGEFSRPQSLAVDEHDHVWVADACNHRVQVFDTSTNEARLVRCWGELGSAPGQLKYPYSLVLDGKGSVYICEFGNHRVQKLTLDGRPLAVWGSQGRERGQLFNPWAIAPDSQGRLYVLDTYNNRIYRIRL